MTSQIIPVEPFDFVIFGGTGDLAERKLLPALYYRQQGHQFSDPTRIIGASRSKLTDEEFRSFAEKALREHVKADDIDEDGLKSFLARLSYVAVDAKSGEGFNKLKKALGARSMRLSGVNQPPCSASGRTCMPSSLPVPNSSRQAPIKVSTSP